MGRITRNKAAAIADQMHIDEDAVLELSSDKIEAAKLSVSDAEDRPPLGELAANSTGSTPNDDTQAENIKPGEVKKGGKKRAKGKKKDNTSPLSESTATIPEHSVEVIPDHNVAVASPARKAASDTFMQDLPESIKTSHLAVQDISNTSPPSSATADLLSESLAQVEQIVADKQGSTAGCLPQQTPEVPNQAESEETSRETRSSTENHAQAPLQAGMPSHAETRSDSPMTPTKQLPKATTPPRSIADGDMQTQSPGEASNYDELEAAVVQAQTPPRSATKDSSSNDSIAALDRLDDAVDQVNAEVPDVQTSPEKPKTKKAAPVVRTTKASQARISLAHGPKDAPKPPSWGRPRQSTVSFDQSTTKRAMSTSTSSGKSGSSAVEDVPAQKREVVIPHSKPRPVSMSFPTPPPPPKSTKAPTQSNFQLPGEAVAAKLKAAREARLAKEAEELEKKRTFKARPAPTSTKAPTVRQTSTSKARQSMMLSGSEPLASTTAQKRASIAVPTSRPSTVRPSLAPAPRPSITKRPSTAMSAAQNSRPASSRPSTAMSAASKGRVSTSTSRPQSVLATTNRQLTSRPSSVLAGTGKPMSKGKEVFSRAAQAQSAAQAEKREREEAAKQARAEAAERSRQLSREWAEKQKRKQAHAAAAKLAL